MSVGSRAAGRHLVRVGVDEVRGEARDVARYVGLQRVGPRLDRVLARHDVDRPELVVEVLDARIVGRLGLLNMSTSTKKRA